MESNKNAITVTVGVFSGRPNPELTLEGETAQRFLDLLRSAIGKEAIHPPPPPRLGEFYGFFVSLPGDRARDLKGPTTLAIRHAVISSENGRGPEHWRDQENIEEFLVNEAYKQGLGGILEKVGVNGPRDRSGYEGVPLTGDEN